MQLLNRGRQALWLLLATCLLLSACQTTAPGLPQAQQQAIERLLTLMDQRLAVAVDVAQTKWNSGAAIDDPVRERQILNELSASLTGANALEKLSIRRFFQAQFDAGKIIQRDLHQQWRQQQHARFAQVPDLARDIRPRLDQLTPQLLDALAQVRPLLMHDDARAWLQQRSLALLAVNVDSAVRTTALAGLETTD